MGINVKKAGVALILIAIMMASFVSAGWEWIQIGDLKEGDVLFNKRRKTFFRIIKLFSDDKKNKESYIHFISANRKTKDDALKTNMTSIIDTDRIVLDCKKINLKNRVDR